MWLFPLYYGTISFHDIGGQFKWASEPDSQGWTRDSYPTPTSRRRPSLASRNDSSTSVQLLHPHIPRHPRSQTSPDGTRDRGPRCPGRSDWRAPHTHTFTNWWDFEVNHHCYPTKCVWINGFPLSPVPLAATAAPPTLAMQPHVVVQAADGTTHLVPATVSKEVKYTSLILYFCSCFWTSESSLLSLDSFSNHCIFVSP